MYIRKIGTPTSETLMVDNRRCCCSTERYFFGLEQLTFQAVERYRCLAIRLIADDHERRELLADAELDGHLVCIA